MLNGFGNGHSTGNLVDLISNAICLVRLRVWVGRLLLIRRPLDAWLNFRKGEPG